MNYNTILSPFKNPYVTAWKKSKKLVLFPTALISSHKFWTLI